MRNMALVDDVDDEKIINLHDFSVQTVTLIIACAVLYFMIKLLMKYVESR